MHRPLSIALMVAALTALTISQSDALHSPSHTHPLYTTCIADPLCSTLFCMVPTPSPQAFAFIVNMQNASASSLSDLYTIAIKTAPKCGPHQTCNWNTGKVAFECKGDSGSTDIKASDAMVFITVVITAMAVVQAYQKLKLQ
jgi:hypothetical protein